MDSGQWDAAINTYHTLQILDQHTVYQIKITDPRKGSLSPYFVSRRYSEFSELYQTLGGSFPLHFPQKVHWSQVTDLLFASETLAEQRRNCFQELVKHCITSKSKSIDKVYVSKFFGIRQPKDPPLLKVVFNSHDQIWEPDVPVTCLAVVSGGKTMHGSYETTRRDWTDEGFIVWDVPMSATLHIYCDPSRDQSMGVVSIEVDQIPFNKPIQHTFPVTRGLNRGTITVTLFYETFEFDEAYENFQKLDTKAKDIDIQHCFVTTGLLLLTEEQEAEKKKLKEAWISERKNKELTLTIAQMLLVAEMIPPKAAFPGRLHLLGKKRKENKIKKKSKAKKRKG
eukprot:TRINITY_DN4642_c0_g1_i3.p1 TRINITY_DN4642_c0_g1~~TRINITY_DN4642_c0_g1_i3.p1  ORF type:complete len:339 (-),score=58.92 TRINITY_DN4642_c0_g1_i3:23-1039(-)